MYDIDLGDIIEVLTDDPIAKFLYAEVVGKYKDNDQMMYEVYYIEPNEDGTCLNYRDFHDVVEEECINYHVRTTRGDYKKAWSKMGFYLKIIDRVMVFEKIIADYENLVSDEESISETDTWSTIDTEDTMDREFIDDRLLIENNEHSKCE